MFVFPRRTAPTSRSRSVICASYGDTYPSRIREPAVHWPPRTEMRSLSATGTPSSGWSFAPSRARSRASAASAWASADSRSIDSQAFSAWLPASAASRCASASPRELIARARSRSPISWAVSRVRSPVTQPPPSFAEDRRHDDVAVVRVRGVGDDIGDGQGRRHRVVAEDVLDLDRLGRRRDLLRIQLCQLRVLLQDVVELSLEER